MAEKIALVTGANEEVNGQFFRGRKVSRPDTRSMRVFSASSGTTA